ncbi:putative F-box/FBD/LRR-repeat protein At4g13965 isoform X2 [Lactuca sativa]|uniref:putative F-box/FBD/LRR-repeat protein At4g13965 isoform X2 n=1 Tax=Lactuca sativa TaxID=4236 RepID=UPI000CD7EA69|nr:putative F-box/FBD/LRR-repeat protein At4g13965 isoform X2 [Lactuca sativa]
MDVESDRLSSLPDDLIHKIISFISIKDAIATSVLSSKWRSIWTSMPYLTFENLNHGPSISNFISNVLSHRDNETQVSSVSLVLGKRVRDDESVTDILNCALSHNVQQLSVTRSPEKIVGRPLVYRLSSIATSAWDLPALTTLHLHHIQLSDDNDFFSKFTNLKNLFLRRCTLMKGAKVLNICLPRLSDLTLEYIRMDMELKEYVNVAAPQLQNLTIKWCAGKHLISAPGLASLVIEISHPWQISTPGFPCLEKADLCMNHPFIADAHEIVCLLQHLRSAKLLILSLGILQRLFEEREHLSSSMELIPHQTCVFANARILKFIPKLPVKVYLEVQAEEKVTEIKNYDTSPGAIFPMVSHKEIKVMGDMASAQIFVKNLRLFLKECKANTNNKAQMDEHGKPQVEKPWAWEFQLNLGEMMALIKQSKSVALETCLIMAKFRPSSSERLQIIEWLQEMRSLFQCIEGLMTPKKDVMQPIFSRLCEDATILTNSILGWMKTRQETQDTNVLSI